MSQAATSTQNLSPYSTTSKSRLQALYSDISRQKTSNPASYRSSIEWWSTALESFLRSNLQHSRNKVVLSCSQALSEQLRIPGVGKPLALGTVVTELQSQKALIPLSTFLSSPTSIYDPGWLPARIAAYVVGKPLWWALEQLGIVGEDGLLGGSHHVQGNDTSWWGEYVFVPLVGRAGDDILRLQEAKPGGISEQLYDFYSFRKEFGCVIDGEDGIMSEMDAKTLLKFLERDKQAVITDNGVIKFIQNFATSDARTVTVTTVDRGIVELKTAITNMQSQVERLQQRIDECTKKASTALQQKQKDIALNYIRTRRQVSELLNKRLGSLQNLMATLLSIEGAAEDLEIMKSYASSTTTLKSILSHPALQRDTIDQTMDALAEANADAKDIDEAIRAGTVANDDLEDDALQAELQSIIKEISADEVEAKLEQVKAPTHIHQAQNNLSTPSKVALSS